MPKSNADAASRVVDRDGRLRVVQQRSRSRERLRCAPWTANVSGCLLVHAGVRSTSLPVRVLARHGDEGGHR